MKHTKKINFVGPYEELVIFTILNEINLLSFRLN